MSIQLIKKRAIIKASLTRFEHFIHSLDKTSLDLPQLESRFKNFESLLASFEEIQLEIELKDDEALDKNVAMHELERCNFEKQYYELQTRAKHLMSSTGSTSSTSGNFNNHQLPKISLPVYDGSYSQWLFFKDTFNSIIHCSKVLSDIEKFHYLRLSLKDEAADVIKSLEVSSKNYETAWQLLTARYENKLLLINNHVEALFNLPVITKESRVGLRSLLDNLNKHLRALNVLGEPVDKWDTLLIHMVSKKLDNITRREWQERNIGSSLSPTMNEFSKFLNERCMLLETLNSEASKINNYKSKSFLLSESSDLNYCKVCTGLHCVNKCTKFLNLSLKDRYKRVKALNLCTNCLKDNHSNKACKSSSCRVCGKRHHTLLHDDNFYSIKPINTPTSSDKSVVFKRDSDANSPSVNEIPDITCSHANMCSQTILCTAVVQLRDSKGKYHPCRVLLDCGSTANLMSQNFFSKLNLNKVKTTMTIAGINDSTSQASYVTNITMKSMDHSFQTKLTCFVVQRITDNLPTVSFDKHSLIIPDNVTLADPEFYRSSNVDLLIGCELFWQLIQTGQISLGQRMPILQNTKLGWIVTGKIHKTYLASQRCNFLNAKEFDNKLTRFWTLEEYSKIPPLSKEEQSAEYIFKTTIQRDNHGRFIVKLPLKQSPGILGESKQTAVKLLLAIERRLNKDLDLRAQYCQFMTEYINLGHMTMIDNERPDEIVYYIPHHFVRKDNSLTTKLRVVFDASCKTSTGYSLNDIQIVGPTIQQDLVSILLRFRSHKYVLSGDIAKMYRQVLIGPDDRRLQRILWRNKVTENIKIYELNTVTYGTASAPFLAIRCLHQIAHENLQQYPTACRIILSDFYVDDLLTGADNVDLLITLYKDISKLLESYGFILNKWVSNNVEILNEIKNSRSDVIINIGDDDKTHSLGLLWYSRDDTLKYETKHIVVSEYPTKRSVLSSVAQIFDPLGLVGPIIVKAKVFLQRLWQLQISWDDCLPTDISTEWKCFASQLCHLNKLEIPRFVLCNSAKCIELHGFADASESAYGACVYIRSLSDDGTIDVHLLASKSRVAPLKYTTIPRLELCAALLLSRLVDKVKTSWTKHFDRIYMWSDSTIVLSWICAESTNWKVFVANRVSEIQTLSDKSDWRYINTLQNPADIISRGLDTKDLHDNKLWWFGPHWLRGSSDFWPQHYTPDISLSGVESEIRKQASVSVVISDNCNIFYRFSNFTRLQRVVAYIRRFKNNTLHKFQQQKGHLTVEELQQSLNTLMHLVQSQAFAAEISDLKTHKNVNRTSKMLKLNPFIDAFGLVRVGGRLRNSNFNFDKKYPIVLPNNHQFTRLLVEYTHKLLLHAGPQLLLAHLRDKYWIITARNLVRRVVHNCITCFRANPTNTTEYLMSDLPSSRVTPSRPFLNVGTDFCGPFNLRDRNLRNFKVTKAYICAFVCFTTKATHLELVSELTSKAFLACLRRFVSRRGKCLNIYSDNGSNYIGANNELKTFISNNKGTLQTNIHQEGIQWHFIPPRSPHMGGLWEANVKSIKHHIKRVIGESKLTFEEFYTVLTQIEACLNSRPLHPLSTDPNDLSFLSPGHFLIGHPLMAIPENQILDNDTLTNRFKQCQQMVQHVWNRWSKEYVSELQYRYKWKKNSSNLMKKDVMVVIKEDSVIPLQWHLGRIIDLHPGDDGIIRVVTVKTANGIYKRPVTKICILPMPEVDTHIET